MAGLYPTPTRLDLLRAVLAGRVWKQAGRTYLDGYRNVTAVVAEEAAAGWVGLADLDPAVPHKRRWDITSTGRAVLARADEAGGAR